MCSTPKSTKSRPRSSATGKSHLNIIEMQRLSDQFDDMDRDAEQFRHLAKSQNDAQTVRHESKNPTSWLKRLRSFLLSQ